MWVNKAVDLFHRPSAYHFPLDSDSQLFGSVGCDVAHCLDRACKHPTGRSCPSLSSTTYLDRISLLLAQVTSFYPPLHVFHDDGPTSSVDEDPDKVSEVRRD